MKGSQKIMKERKMQRYKRNRRGRKRTVNITPIIFLTVLIIGTFGFIGVKGFEEELKVNPTDQVPIRATNSMNRVESGQNRNDLVSNTEMDWNLTLVNKYNAVPNDYEINLVELPGGEKVDERIYKPLMAMLEAADAENLGPIVVSGYRTQEEQQELYDEKIDEYREQGYSQEEATEQAKQWVAVPGYSEHQLGLAVDINGAVYDIYSWLQENSYKYGFIFRYPGDKIDITGTAQEVWHYRYVGVEAATQMYEKGLCLEEYLQMN